MTVVGALLGVQPGESLRLVGRWSSHPRYGRQFEVESYTTVLPATIQGIERYLGSGLIKGIGPRTAGRIVGHFGVDTLRVIEEQPQRLVEVAGLGPKRTAMIGKAWEEQKAIKEVMVFLQGVGVSTSLAVRIYKKYGDGSISVVRMSRTGWPPRCGGSGSRPPTPSPRRSGSRTTARSRCSGVDPGRPAGVSTGGFPRAAPRTRRARFRATGAPQVPLWRRGAPHPVTGHGAGIAAPRYR